MKPLLLLLLPSGLILSGCQQNIELQKELLEAQMALEETQAALQEAKTELEARPVEKKGQLVHLVYFQLKPGITEEERSQLITEIENLKKIPGLEHLQVGRFKDLGDERALSEFGMVMQMSFANETAYRTYQSHPVHLELREKLSSFLVGPPVTYDFILE